MAAKKATKKAAQEDAAQTRLERAVLSKLDVGLDGLRRDLEESGAPPIDLSPFADAIRKSVAAEWSELPETSEGSLLAFGSDTATCPDPLVRSVVAGAARRIVKQLLACVEASEKAADARLERWAAQRTGVEDAAIDWKRLVVRDRTEDRVVKSLGLARQVLDFSPEKARSFVANSEGQTDDDLIRFAADLAKARLHSDAADKFLRSLWNVADPRALETILEDRVVKALLAELRVAGHQAPVNFYLSGMSALVRMPESSRRRILGEIGSPKDVAEPEVEAEAEAEAEAS